VGGLLLSHAHLDHAGYLPYLREDLPVTTSVISGALLKSLQDTNRQLYSELIAVAAKELLDTGILKTAKGSPSNQGLSTFFKDQRTLMASMTTFGTAITQKKPYLPATPDYLENSCQIAKYNIKAWPVDHSIPGAMAYAVRPQEGWIVLHRGFKATRKQRQPDKSVFPRGSSIAPSSANHRRYAP